MSYIDWFVLTCIYAVNMFYTYLIGYYHFVFFFGMYLIIDTLGLFFHSIEFFLNCLNLSSDNVIERLIRLNNLCCYYQQSNNFLLYYIIGYLTFVAQITFIVAITIWSRAAGPRFRLDQLLTITWKDIFIYLSLFLLFVLFIVIIA